MKPRIRPPTGLLIALAAQTPLLIANWPLRPGASAIGTGSLLLAAGVVLNVWAERLFRRAAVGVRPFTPAPVVINTGPYRVTRNPMYIGLLAINLSAAFFTGVLTNVWSSVAFAIWLQYAFVLPEEEFLIRESGGNYRDYAQRVPRWLIVRSAETQPRAALESAPE